MRSPLTFQGIKVGEFFRFVSRTGGPHYKKTGRTSYCLVRYQDHSEIPGMTYDLAERDGRSDEVEIAQPQSKREKSK